ncbi:RNA-directed DNA polymerase from mobile element jockey [Patella vulgata]|uniref:RNA-directed DNA polymerase from mobile element jockey n=1 Tax=Patella vulgata TaxID=6465 RepID=UPI0024A9B4FE|nr:RNA-directed DNA polymerase from mobile element jockey [Patella vulgata]
MLVITESWLKPNGDEHHITAMTLPSHSFVHLARSHTTGGGIAVIYRRSIIVEVLSNKLEAKTFEQLPLRVTASNKCFIVVCIYRPPPSAKNKLSSSDFYQEFAILFSSYSKPNTIILGDFNIQINNTIKSDVKRYVSLIDCKSYNQHVMEPTHKSGNTLDWVVAANDSDLVKEVHVENRQISDHYYITAILKLSRPQNLKKEIICRNIKAIDWSTFRVDISNSKLLLDPMSDVNVQVNLYNNTLSALLDKHAPATNKTVTVRNSAPWYNNEVKQSKCLRHRAERKFRKTHLEIHRQIYCKAKSDHLKIISKSKQKYCRTYIQNCKNDPGKVHRFLKSLLGKKPDRKLPSSDNNKSLADSFNDFFINKIEKIRSGLNSSTDSENTQTTLFGGHKLCSFKPFSKEEIKNIIMASKPTTCLSDPIPTHLVLQLIDQLLPFFTQLINNSLTTGTFPDCFKSSIVLPLLKKDNLDKNIMKNYSPVSNLPFLSKIIEKAVNIRLNEHLTANSLLNVFQSAYRQYHSTETALLRVVNDLRSTADSGCIASLVLLDLSAAFDTIDHTRLLGNLLNRCGIDGYPLSYLQNRSQSGTDLSERTSLACGVPQGSVLGPVLFVLYTNQLSDIISNHGFNHHSYADDTQIIGTFSADCYVDFYQRTSACTTQIKSWMTSNMLKLNDDKTEVLFVGTNKNLSNLDSTTLTIADSDIQALTNVKNLGVMLDSALSMETHVNYICKVCYFHLRAIGNIRHLLTNETAHTLVRSLVFSRLDYCNGVLSGLNQLLMSKLQAVQNTASRIIS